MVNINFALYNFFVFALFLGILYCAHRARRNDSEKGRCFTCLVALLIYLPMFAATLVLYLYSMLLRAFVFGSTTGYVIGRCVYQSSPQLLICVSFCPLSNYIILLLTALCSSAHHPALIGIIWSWMAIVPLRCIARVGDAKGVLDNGLNINEMVNVV